MKRGVASRQAHRTLRLCTSFALRLDFTQKKPTYKHTHAHTQREQNTIARATHTHTHAQEQTLFTACSARGDLGSVILSLRGKQRYLPTNTFFLPNSDYVDVNGILPKKNFKSHKSTRQASKIFFLFFNTNLSLMIFHRLLLIRFPLFFFFQKHTPTKSTNSLSLHCFNFVGSLASLDAPPSTTPPQRGRGEEENLSFDALTRFRAASKGIRATAFKPPHLHMHQRLVSLALVDG